MNTGVLDQDDAGQRQTDGYIQFLGRRLKAEDAAHIAGTDINSYRHHPRNVTIPARPITLWKNERILSTHISINSWRLESLPSTFSHG